MKYTYWHVKMPMMLTGKQYKYQNNECAAAAAKSLQSCPTLCDPIDGSPSGSPVPGILQARILEWVAISFSNAWKWKVKVKSLSRVQLLATAWTAAYQAPLSMGFSRQEYWSRVPLPSSTCLFWKIKVIQGLLCMCICVNVPSKKTIKIYPKCWQKLSTKMGVRLSEIIKRKFPFLLHSHLNHLD